MTRMWKSARAANASEDSGPLVPRRWCVTNVCNGKLSEVSRRLRILPEVRRPAAHREDGGDGDGGVHENCGGRELPLLADRRSALG